MDIFFRHPSFKDTWIKTWKINKVLYIRVCNAEKNQKLGYQFRKKLFVNLDVFAINHCLVSWLDCFCLYHFAAQNEQDMAYFSISELSKDTTVS